MAREAIDWRDVAVGLGLTLVEKGLAGFGFVVGALLAWKLLVGG